MNDLVEMSKRMNETISSKINKLLQEENWSQVTRIVTSELRRAKDNWWLLTILSKSYLEQGNFEKALRASEKAYRYARENPLVMWDYGHALYMTQKYSKSLNIFKKLCLKRPKVISKTMNWSEKKSKELKNSCRFDIAMCYLQLDKIQDSIRWLRKCLRYYVYGIKNYYPIDTIQNKLKQILKVNDAAKKKTPRVWISLLEVKRTSKKNRAMYRCGFTNGLVFATDRKKAYNILRHALLEKGYTLLSAKNLEEYERRILKYEVHKDLEKLAISSKMRSMPQFGTFYLYRQ